MKVEATVGNVTVSVVDGAVVLGNVGQDATVTIEAGNHKEVSKTITKLLRIDTKPTVKVEGEKRGRKAKTPASAQA